MIRSGKTPTIRQEAVGACSAVVPGLGTQRHEPKVWTGLYSLSALAALPKGDGQ